MLLKIAASLHVMFPCGSSCVLQRSPVDWVAGRGQPALWGAASATSGFTFMGTVDPFLLKGQYYTTDDIGTKVSPRAEPENGFLILNSESRI